MVAFAGRKYAARSTPIFVSNTSVTVSSFTLVRIDKRTTMSAIPKHVADEFRILLLLDDDSSAGARVQQRQTSKPALEEGRLRCLLRQIKLRLPWQTDMRHPDAELQEPRACRLQRRHPAGFLRHGQARVGSELVVRGVQPEAVLPLRALLKPQGHPERPVQQDLLGCFGAAIVYSPPCSLLFFLSVAPVPHVVLASHSFSCRPPRLLVSRPVLTLSELYRCPLVSF